MAVSHIVNEYTVAIRQNQADIHLYTAGNLVGSIYFFADASQLGPAAVSNGRVVLRYPLSEYPYVIDILRNETPVRLFYSTPQVAYISCGKEPVGEEES